MATINDISRKRAILLTTRIRFSPKIQPIKESAIDMIVLQIMFTNNSGNSLSSNQIQELLSFETYAPIINIQQIEESLIRLKKDHRIIIEERDDNRYYSLTKRSNENIAGIEERANYNFNNVLTRLFRTKNINIYYDAFLKFLCIIFSQLGEESVHIIKGDIDKDKLISYPFFKNTLAEINKEFPDLDHNLFERASVTFFKEKEPDFDLLKWNLAQSYYISKSLGVDPTGSLLSEEIFYNADFYLDTNVLISALEPNDKNHTGFLTLNKACKKLNIKLKVCQVTIDELNNWLSHQYDLMEKTISFIPRDLSQKISDMLYRVYINEKKKNNNVTIEDIFKNFINPEYDLKKRFDIDLIDDDWFSKNIDNQIVQNFSLSIINKYYNLRSRPKSKKAGLHDSLVLLWIKKLKEDNKKNVWFATLDSTLPGVFPADHDNGSLAITLGALLQWISPLVIKKGEEYTFTSIFSEIIKLRLLPREKMFELSDFLIFHELDISCKELPSEDVENCVINIKQKAPDLNPTDPKDREKLAYEVEKFFLDTGRKYKMNLSNLEKELRDAKNEIEIRDKKFNNYKKKMEENDLKNSAKKRLNFTIILAVVLFGIATYLTYTFSPGDNVFQRLFNSHSWYVYLIALSLSGLLARFILGKRRIEILGWKFDFLKKKN